MSKKILIVEDEMSLQNSIKEFLLMEKFEVIAASDGEMGAKMIKSEKPDLVLLDVILPKKDGFGVLTDIKADEETKHIPVILLTNLEGADDVDKAFSFGVNAYLVKANYRLEEIVGKIKEMLKM